MEYVSAVAPLIPSMIDMVKEIIVASRGDDQVAIGMILGVLGATEENRTRAAIVVAKARAIQELGLQQPG